MKGIERTFNVEHTKSLAAGQRHVLRHRIQSDFVAGTLRLSSPDPMARLFYLGVGDRPLFDMDEGILVSTLSGDLLGAFPLLSGIAMPAGLDLRLDVVFGPDDATGSMIETDADMEAYRKKITEMAQDASSLLVIVRPLDDQPEPDEVKKQDTMKVFTQAVWDLARRCKGRDLGLREELCELIDVMFDGERYDNGGDQALLRAGKLPADPSEGAVEYGGPPLEATIAEVCHAANRVLTRIACDVPVQPTWAGAPDDMRESSIAGVRWRLANLDAPASAQHDEWMRHKLAGGWTLGPVRDAERKTHPALVPYDDLPKETKAKDAVFTAIVRALSGYGDDVEESPVVVFTTMPAEWHAVVVRAAAQAGVPVEQYVKVVVAREAAAVVRAEAAAAAPARARPPSITEDDLNRWFTYHPPDDTTFAHYKAIRAAEVACFKVVENLLVHYSRETAERNGGEPPRQNTEDRIAHHAAANDVLLAFARVVLEHAPDSADRTASIRAIRLARNALNEAIAMKNEDGVHGPVVREILFDRAVTALYDARWQAAGAIACGGR